MTTKTGETNQRAREAALAAAQAVSVRPTGLVSYTSRGTVAVVGGERAVEAVSMMGTRLESVLVRVEDGPAAGSRGAAGGRAAHLDGHLGHFTLTLEQPDAVRGRTVTADVVLDLGDTPLVEAPLVPPGYLRPGPSVEDLEAAIDSAAELRGTFEKPKYFVYDPSICAHGRRGITACSRCIDACPAEAIRGLADSIEVDPYRCQGGGVCASVCPSGAIRYAYPPAADTLAVIRRMLAAWREQGAPGAVLLLHGAGETLPAELPDNALAVELEELAAAGPEIWLGAIAFGAGAVLLIGGADDAARVHLALDEQLSVVARILGALGYPREAVRRVGPDRLESECRRALMPPLEPAGFSGEGAKRDTLFMAIDALYAQSPAATGHVPPRLAELPAGAPFGRVEVDPSACTLCLACVGVCPGNALSGGQDTPRLRFVESHCLQCGLCVRACPEDAIRLSARILFDRQPRNRARTLNEEEPFCCVSCGKPFATRSVIERTRKRLAGHWMFTDERARRRLEMCEDCRVADVVQDPSAMERETPGERRSH